MKFSGWRWKKGRRLSKVFPPEYFKRYFEHFTTKRNHWTLCLNCLIKFSVAAKLKICFLYFFVEKNLMFLFYPSFMSANRWYLAHFTRLFQAFPLAILLSSSRLPFQSEWKTKRFLFRRYESFSHLRRVYVIELLIFHVCGAFQRELPGKSYQKSFEMNCGGSDLTF